jgi:hypothetical protein
LQVFRSDGARNNRTQFFLDGTGNYRAFPPHNPQHSFLNSTVRVNDELEGFHITKNTLVMIIDSEIMNSTPKIVNLFELLAIALGKIFTRLFGQGTGVEFNQPKVI